MYCRQNEIVSSYFSKYIRVIVKKINSDSVNSTFVEIKITYKISLNLNLTLNHKYTIDIKSGFNPALFAIVY